MKEHTGKNKIFIVIIICLCAVIIAGQIQFLQTNAFFLEFLEFIFRHITDLSATVLTFFLDHLLCAEILGFNSENL